jgi:hypothetical protein
MLTQMYVGGVMACTHDHVPPEQAYLADVPASCSQLHTELRILSEGRLLETLPVVGPGPARPVNDLSPSSDCSGGRPGRHDAVTRDQACRGLDGPRSEYGHSTVDRETFAAWRICSVSRPRRAHALSIARLDTLSTVAPTARILPDLQASYRDIKAVH